MGETTTSPEGAVGPGGQFSLTRGALDSLSPSLRDGGMCMYVITAPCGMRACVRVCVSSLWTIVSAWGGAGTRAWKYWPICARHHPSCPEYPERSLTASLRIPWMRSSLPTSSAW